jgi:4-alpha-glucanotransferase
MNVPSTTGGINWQWRMTPEMFSAEKALWLKEMSVLYGRNKA